MTTNAPPAYEYPNLGATEGGNDAPPAYAPVPIDSPAITPTAPSAPSAVTPTTPQQPVTIQQPIPQADVAAPVAGPQQNVQYVNQYGQPIQPPASGDGIQQQPKVQYVNQFGQPIQAPVVQQVQQPAVKYVNQYGQPIAAPVVQQPAVQYVNQYGQPISAASIQPMATTVQPQATFKPAVNQVEPPSYKNPSPKQKNMRNIATTIGFLSFVLLFIAMVSGQLATGEYSGLDIECTFYRVDMDIYGWYYDDHYYSTNCNDWGWDSDNSDLGFDSDDWCGTYGGANWFITMTVFSFLFTIPAIIIGQPWCFIERCCCKVVMPKLFYGICTFLSLMAIILWYAQDRICTQNLELRPGISPILVIINTILVFIAAIVVS